MSPVPRPEESPGNERPSFDDVKRAAERIAGVVHRTPVARCASLDRITGATLFFKCENMQRSGAFKYRGASNAVRSLTPAEARSGVATHSSGNHAGALARAARVAGIAAHLVMPVNAVGAKRRAVLDYGGRITSCANTLAARETTLAEVVARTGATVIHPYDDPRVIAGQGTAALELLEDAGPLDCVVAPVGGGGLLSGTSLTVAGFAEGTEVYGAEPARADDARRSLEGGVRLPSVDPQTVADGLLTSLGRLPFEILLRHGRRVLTTPDTTTVQAMRDLWERAKILVEPSAAVALAAVYEHREVFRGRRVGLILSGGNIDLEHLPF